jgi:hypothetical protein
MTDVTIIAVIGLFLTNLSVILAAWIKMKTDIAAINVQVKSIEFRVLDVEVEHSKETDKIHNKVDKFLEANNSQHETISNKVDAIKDQLSKFQIDIIKQLK